MEQLAPELVTAACTVLATLRHRRMGLGGAYDRALIAATDGDAAVNGTILVAAIEAGHQAVHPWPPVARDTLDDAVSTAEIVILRRFRAAGREFEPNQRYRLTALEFRDVEWRAALEPDKRLYRRTDA